MLSLLLQKLCVALLLSQSIQVFGLKLSNIGPNVAGPGWAVHGRGLANNYGDPTEGDLPSGKLCSVSKSDPKKASSRSSSNGTTLVPRTEPRSKSVQVEKQPLTDPASDSTDDFADFMEEIANHANPLPVFAHDDQFKHFNILYNGVFIPSAATAEVNRFGHEKQAHTMEGLTGCTAIIAVSSNGIYAAHLWEAEEQPNMGASFTKKYIDQDGEVEIGIRSLEEFQRVAVDIFSELTPAEDVPFRNSWVSIADMRQDRKNIFPDKSEVDIFVLTRGAGDRDQIFFKPQISRLQTKFQELIPGCTWTVKAYHGENFLIHPKVQGMINVQYTPYDHVSEDGCSPMARVRVFYEDEQTPIIDKSWHAHLDQRIYYKKPRHAPRNPIASRNLTTELVDKSTYIVEYTADNMTTTMVMNATEYQHFSTGRQ